MMVTKAGCTLLLCGTLSDRYVSCFLIMPAFCLLPDDWPTIVEGVEEAGMVTSSTSAVASGGEATERLASLNCSMWQLFTDMRTVAACGCSLAAVLCSPEGRKLGSAASADNTWLTVAEGSPVGARGGSRARFQLTAAP